MTRLRHLTKSAPRLAQGPRLPQLLILGLAILSICLTLLPILASAYRGDDQFGPALFLSEIQGKGLLGASVLEGINFVKESGRVVPGWVTILILEFSLFESRIAYKVFLVFMTLLVLFGTTWFVRLLTGLSWLFSFLVTSITVGIAIQFRISPTFADPYLSVVGKNQLGVLLFFLAIAAIVWLASSGRTRMQQRAAIGFVCVVFALQCYLYEANFILGSLLILILFLVLPARRALWMSIPVALVALLSVAAILVAREVATDPMDGYVANFAPFEVLRTGFLLGFSNLPLTFPLANPELLVDPSRREVGYGLIAAMVLGGTTWGTLVLLRGAAVDSDPAGIFSTIKPLPLSNMKALIVALMLIVVPSLPFTLSEKYQVEAAVGRTHLTVIFGLVGVVLAAAVGVRWLKSTGRLRPVTVFTLTLVVSIAGFGTAISNVRSIGLDRVGLKQREAFEDLLNVNDLGKVVSEATILVSNRDFGWAPGNLNLVFNEFILVQTGRKADFRLVDFLAQACPGLGGDQAQPDPLCQDTRSGGLWFLALRVSRERDVALLSRLSDEPGVHKGLSWEQVSVLLEKRSARDMIVLVKERSSGSGDTSPNRPSVTGLLPGGKSWDSGDIRWKSSRPSSGWVSFRSVRSDEPLPTPISVTDPDSKIDFYADTGGRSARERVDIFGHSWLPPW